VTGCVDRQTGENTLIAHKHQHPSKGDHATGDDHRRSGRNPTVCLVDPNMDEADRAAAALWKAWAPDLTVQFIQAGHFMAEEKPAEIAAFITELAARGEN
jgi:hypothetical protein